MRFRHGDLLIEYGTEDLQAPASVGAIGSPVSLTIKVSSASATRSAVVRTPLSLTVQCTLDGERAPALATAQIGRGSIISPEEPKLIQLSFAEIPPGRICRYVVVCRQAGRETPSRAEAARILAEGINSFRIPSAGVRTKSSGDLGKELLGIINSAESAARLAGMFADAPIDARTWVQVYAVREQLPLKQFTSLTELAALASIDERLLVQWFLEYGGQKWPGRPQPTSAVETSNEYPVLMLPVRLETRFIGRELLIRIYPDQIFLDTHDSRISQAELDAGHRYLEGRTVDPRGAWRVLAQKYGPERAAWIVKTVDQLGESESPDLKPNDEGWFVLPKLAALPDRFAAYLYRDDQLTRPPVIGEPIKRPLAMIGHPASGAADLFDENSRWVTDFEQAVEDGMAIRVDLEGEDLEEGFTRVVVVGLRRGGHGAGHDSLEALLNSHHYSTGLGFVPWGTPTNNSGAGKSGHSESSEDREDTYETEIEGSVSSTLTDVTRTNAQRLGQALGLGAVPAVLHDVAHATDDDDSYAREMQIALWPCTGDYLLRNLLSGLVLEEHLARLGHHFADFVRASGPLPCIRLGDQRYGILPVVHFRGWHASVDDQPVVVTRAPVTPGMLGSMETRSVGAPRAGLIPTGDPGGARFDEGLYKVLAGLLTQWAAWANDPRRVPKIGASEDPDDELLRALAMEPLSLSYRVRPFVDERFVSWLLVAMRDYVFGEGTPYAQLADSPLVWVQRWADAWEEVRQEQTKLWQEWAGLASGGSDAAAFRDTFASSNLLKMTAWWNARPLMDFDMDLVRYESQAAQTDSTENGSSDEISTQAELPEIYLDELCRNASGESDYAHTLLKDLLQRSLAFAPARTAPPFLPGIGGLQQRAVQPIDDAMVRSSICRLVDASVLNFLNAVSRPDEIVARLSDQPGLGLDRQLGTRILMMRDALPGRRFQSIEQVSAILGGDQESLRQVIHAFRDQESLAVVGRLFREAMDLCSNRLDAWITSLATKRLLAMRRNRPSGIHLGAYGYVENLRPDWSELVEDYESVGWYETNQEAAGNRLYDQPKNYRFGRQSIGLVKHATTTRYGDVRCSGRSHDLRGVSTISVDVYLPEDVPLSATRSPEHAPFAVAHPYRGAVFSGGRLGAVAAATVPWAVVNGLLSIEIHLGDAELRNASVFMFSTEGLRSGTWNTLTFNLLTPDAKTGDGAPLSAIDAVLVRFAFASEQSTAAGILVDWMRSVQGSAGYIHAPSSGHAAAAAVLHNAYLTHAGATASNPFRINLDSARVRQAQGILEGIRQGQPLGALLGYQFERNLHELRLDQYIDEFRAAFPLVATKGGTGEAEEEGNATSGSDSAGSVLAIAARNVVDGLALARWWKDPSLTNVSPGDTAARDLMLWLSGRESSEEYDIPQDEIHGLRRQVEGLRDSVDAVSDALMYEGVYHAVRGNYDRGSAAIEAISGQTHPPDLESVQTPVPGKTLSHRLLLLFREETVPQTASAAARFEPRIQTWASDLFGDLGRIGCAFDFMTKRINVNEAVIGTLQTLPGIGHWADAIVEYRATHGSFGSVEDLGEKVGIDSTTLEKLRPWIMTGNEEEEDWYYERLNVNTASAAELQLLGFDQPAANAIVAGQASGYRRLADLASVSVGLDRAQIDGIRPFATTGVMTVDMNELGLDAVDLLYLSATPIEGEETEIERRIYYFARAEFGLQPEVRVGVDAARQRDYTYGLEEALELGRQAFETLAVGYPLRPDGLRSASDAAATFKVDLGDPDESRVTFAPEDVTRLDQRVRSSLSEVCSLLLRLGAQPLFPRSGRSPGSPPPSDGAGGRQPSVPRTSGVAGGSRPGPVPSSDFSVTPLFEQLVEEPVAGASPLVLDQLFEPPRVPAQVDGVAAELVAADIVKAFRERRYEELRALAFSTADSNVRLGWYEQLADALEADTDEPMDIVQTLHSAATLGARSALLRSPNDPELLQRWMETITDLLDRVRRCQEFRARALGPDAPQSTERQIRLVIDAARALFGNALVVLPTFTPSNHEDLAAAFDRPGLLGSADEHRVRLWLQQLALVDEAPRLLDQTLEMSEAWRSVLPDAGTFAIGLSVGQLPTDYEKPWVALDNEERGESLHDHFEEGRNLLSFVAATNDSRPMTFDGLVAGLVLHERDEHFPSDRVDTSIGFQYDGPNNQAPQALLLAVPRDRAVASWTEDELADVVVDAMDLAKIRLVDADAMGRQDDDAANESGVGMVLPALMMPADPARDGMGMHAFRETIDDWFTALENPLPACIVGQLDFPHLTTTEGNVWTLIGHSRYPLKFYAAGLPSDLLDGASVEVRGYASNASRRIYVVDYAVLTYPATFEAAQAEHVGRGTWRGSSISPVMVFEGTNGEVFTLHGAACKEIAARDVRIRGRIFRNPSWDDALWIDSYEILEAGGYTGRLSIQPEWVSVTYDPQTGESTGEYGPTIVSLRTDSGQTFTLDVSARTIENMAPYNNGKVWVRGALSGDGGVIDVSIWGGLREGEATINCPNV